MLHEGLDDQLEDFTLLHEAIRVLILLLLNDQLEHKLLVSVSSIQDDIHYSPFQVESQWVLRHHEV